MRLAPIGEFVEPIRTWNPTVTPDKTFSYVDLSAVDQIDKQIKFALPVRGSEAPSRARQLISKGDILVSTVRPNLNGVAPVTDAFDGATASTGFCVLRPRREKLASNYLMHWVRSPQFINQMVREATGASYPAVSDRIIKASHIPLPSLNEQRRIAAILDKADALRRDSREALVLADELGHAFYRSNFGDPVRNPLKLPTTTLGELGVEMAYGPRFYNEQYSEEGTRIVRITDLSESGELDFEAMPKLSVSDDELRNHRSRPGELFFARTGATVGKVALVSANDPISIPGAYFIRLRFPTNIEPLFAWYTLRSYPIQKIIAERSRQSAQQNFSGPGLRRLPFIVPPLAQQKVFADQIIAIQKSQLRYREQITGFNDLFSSLQSLAFSGQL